MNGNGESAVAGGLLLHLGPIALGSPSHRVRTAEPAVATARDRLGLLAIGVLSLVVLLFGIHVPDGLVTLLQRAADVVGGF